MNNAVKPNAVPEGCPSANPLVAMVLPHETPVSTVLRAARDLISVPERWTKWGYGFKKKPSNRREAQTVAFWTVPEQATCFCSLGAVRAVTGRSSDTHPAVRVLESIEGVRMVHEFNDDPETTHADVLRMFNRAIKKAEELEASEASLSVLH